MRELGLVYGRDPEPGVTLARQTGWLIGAELRAASIDLCFAPCVDLDWGVSEIIGDRAWHAIRTRSVRSRAPFAAACGPPAWPRSPSIFRATAA